MSIQKRERKKGTVYVAHYYDTDAKKYRNKTFDRKRDAEAYEAQVTLAKRTGELAELDAGKETFSEFEAEWWTKYADVHLSTHTRKSYRYLLDKWILPRWGDTSLRRIKPMEVAAWSEKLLTETGAPQVRRILSIFQGILERAVEWERIKHNPVKAVKKPAHNRRTTPTTLDPAGVQRIIHALSSSRDRTLIAVLAYAGLRPGEALGLEWGDVGSNVLTIQRAVALGEEKSTKTGSSRTVRLLNPLREDLVAWKLASGLREGLVFPRKDGRPWTDYDYRNWRKRVWKTVAPEGMRPYDLRHSFASLLLQEGRTPAYIAEQLGHSVQTLLNTYIHVIEELRDADRIDPEALIREARSSVLLGEGTSVGATG